MKEEEGLRQIWLTVCAAAALICAALVVIVVFSSCIDINNPFLELSKVGPREVPEPPPPPPPPPPPEEGDPEVPRITVQPQGALYTVNMAAAALTVSAEVDDEGALSCQWYRASENSAEKGTAIDSETQWQYAPPTDVVGIFYYYAIITNTLNEKTAAVTSDTARIEILDGYVTGMEIAEQPSLLTYTHGDALDLAGLVITVTYNNDTSEDIASASFAARNIAASPAHGETLVSVAHNGKTVAVTFAGLTVETNKLTVNKAIPEITFPTAAALVYGARLSDSVLTGGSVEFGSFAWANGQTIPVVNQNGYDVFFTPFDTENYDYTGITGWNGDTVMRRVAITVSPQIIDDANVIVVGPATGQAPSAWADIVGSYMQNGATIWSSPDDQNWDPLYNTFLGSKRYTAVVTLLTNENYLFANTVSGTINGNDAQITNNSGRQITLTYTFTPTDSRIVTGFSLYAPPTRNLTYTEGSGEFLELAGLTVMFTYNDGSRDTVPVTQFAERGVSINIPNRATLSVTHNGVDLIVSYGTSPPIKVGTITVYKRAGLAVTNPHTVASVTANSITLNPATVVLNPLYDEYPQSIEYAISTTLETNPANLGWTLGNWTNDDKLYFGGLIANMTYYVYARTRENEHRYAGAMVRIAVPLQSFLININQITDGNLNLTFTDGITGAPMDTIVLYHTREPHTARITITGVTTGYTFQWTYNGSPFAYGATLTIDVNYTNNYGFQKPGRHYITLIATPTSANANAPPISKRFELMVNY